jgi:hypothetical protein
MRWIKFNEEEPPNGRYYIKALMTNGQIEKLLETYRDGEWQLGSGHFVIRLILEWLKEEPTDNILKP